MTYLALLRGINVGGNNKISMGELKLAFESLGFDKVTTYINSGNIIFNSNDDSSDDLAKVIEKAIEEKFGLEVKVLVKNYEQIKKLNENIPADWTNDLEQKTDILFLWEIVDYPKIVDEIEHTSKVDNLIYCESAIIWNIDRRQYFNGSRMNKLVGTKVYKNMTARNVNTVRKLKLLMEKTNC
jgi:uncharacterized protein (DUF1697 family)